MPDRTLAFLSSADMRVPMEDVTFNRVGETSGMKVVQRLHQLALLVLLVALPSYAHAQDGRIAGRVTDQETGAPIAGVQVHIEALNLGTVTQEDGRLDMDLDTSDRRSEEHTSELQSRGHL